MEAIADLLPGVTHCRGGSGPDQVDWLTVLSQWVEKEKPPQLVVARKLDQLGKVTMSRPLYPYPLRAVYTGSGNVNEAKNFVLPETEKRRDSPDFPQRS